MLKRLFALSMLTLLGAPLAQAERIKDMAQVQGVRTNQLIGYGLVVGLDGSGDQTSQAPFTVQSLKNMLAQLGVTVPANVNPQLKNVAAVSVHAVMPAFVKPGQTIDITVNSIANAKSLRGGSLLVTPLHGLDGQIYAIAQGNLIVSGFGVEGTDGSKLTVNVPSSGRIPNGATIERARGIADHAGRHHHPQSQRPGLHHGNAAGRERQQGHGRRGRHDHRRRFGAGARTARRHAANRLSVDGGEFAGGPRQCRGARHHQFAYGHGGHQQQREGQSGRGVPWLVVGHHQRRAERQSAGTLRDGRRDKVVTNSVIKVDQGSSRMFLFKPGVELEQIVRAVNEVGAAPGDLVAILEALREAGALQAELIVI